MRNYRKGCNKGSYWAQDVRTGILVFGCKSEKEAIEKLDKKMNK